MRTRTRESSFLPLPSVAEWMSVPKKQTADRTRLSKAAYGEYVHISMWKHSAAAYSECLKTKSEMS